MTRRAGPVVAGRAARLAVVAVAALAGSGCSTQLAALSEAGALRDSGVVGAAAGLGLLALLLAARARRAGYGWFGAAALLWAMREWSLPVGPLGTVLHHAGFAWISALAGLFALNAVGRDTPAARRALGGWAVLALALAVAALLLRQPALLTLMRGGTIVVALGLLGWLATLGWRHRAPAALLLTGATALGLAIGARDVWVLGLPAVPDTAAWSRYTVLLLLAVGSWLLADEFARSSTALRTLNRELQDRVAQKERELEIAFEGTRRREQQRAVLAERDRILREMHDGLGGRLVAAMALTSQVERQSLPPPGGAVRSVDTPLGDLKLTLDDCLVELRLALDSLETDRRPLIEALAELRFRVEPSLRAAGVRLVWQVGEAASGVELPATDTLHVLRIVREALTNVIKHAHATVVWLRLETRGAQRIALAVVDNGLQQRMSEAQVDMPLFVPPTIVRGGRGLANMTRRAAQLGARLESGPHPEGWSVTLELAVPEAAPSA